ncbi:olfactory receptor class A related 2 isoform X2 [Echeneis naucrates]|uniref:olfactory receptor class A related 2 isoform X2 n=1 Tax=Echeneis naucrates TaxID=173247 RepID=UPI0011135415|nr:uncharacterized protein LOC115043473 isoform X2 [Echeneis naucrates]
MKVFPLLSAPAGMSSEQFVRGMLYLSLTVVGVPGNTAVILAFLLLLHQENRLLPADAIILHLASANLLVDLPLPLHLAHLCSERLPVPEHCPSRIMLGLSSSLGSPLSGHSLLLPLVSKEANGAAQVGRDVVPMALMTLASLIILVFLYKHSQQVKGLRSSKSGGGSCGRSGGAEQRAAKAVVMLVSLYVVLYGVDNGLWVYTLTVRRTMSSSFISDLRIFFSSLYAALSPVVIIVSNRKVNGTLRCAVQQKPVQEKTKSLSAI